MSTETKLEVSLQSDDDLRALVRDILSGQVLTDQQVPAHLIQMVFMPLGFGALQVPEKLLVEKLGSATPPDRLPEDPGKPTHPGYPAQIGDPPEKPKLKKVPRDLVSDVEWGDAEQEELERVRAEVSAENEKRIRKWEDASMTWQQSIDAEAKVNAKIDEEYAKTVQQWQELIDSNESKKKEREALREDWEVKYKTLASEWASDLGVVFGYMKDAAPRGINGYPMFFSMSLLHKDDWARVRAAVIREQDRAKNIDV